MFSDNPIVNEKIQGPLKQALLESWDKLSEKQKNIAKKIWSVLTYKWQWQIAMNAPFMAIWVLDQTIPAVHRFDMHLIASLPIPQWLSMFIGLK